jgi:hypothetical protein
MMRKFFNSTLLGCFLISYLVACGGSTGSGSQPIQATSTVLLGTVATGAPLTNATISALCNLGGAPVTGTTNPDGKYMFSLPTTCKAPYFLKASGIDNTVMLKSPITLYGFADSPANINITPFTDIAARIATSGDPGAAYSAVGSGNKKNADYWNTASVSDARSKLSVLLGRLGLTSNGLTDLLHQPFEAKSGDKLNDLLAVFDSKRNGTSLAVLAELVANNGGSPEREPWNALFPAGVSTISIDAMNCQLDFFYEGFVAQNQSISTSVVIKMNRSKSNFSVEILPSPSTTTTTLAVLKVGLAPGVDESRFAISSRKIIDSKLNIFAGSYIYAPVNNTSLDISGKGLVYQDITQSVTKKLVCNQLSKSFGDDDIPNFHPQARIASYLANTPSLAITSEVATPRGCEEFNFQTPLPSSLPFSNIGTRTIAYTFSYAISPIGDVIFDNAKFPFNLEEKVTNAYNYTEAEFFNAAGQSYRSFIYMIPNNRNNGVTMKRDFAANAPPFTHSCY